MSSNLNRDMPILSGPHTPPSEMDDIVDIETVTSSVVNVTESDIAAAIEDLAEPANPDDIQIISNDDSTTSFGGAKHSRCQ